MWISGRRTFGTGVARQRAEPRFHGVHRLDPGGEAFALDFPDDQPGVLDQRGPIRVHQDDDRRVVAEGHQRRAGVGDRRIRLARPSAGRPR